MYVCNVLHVHNYNEVCTTVNSLCLVYFIFVVEIMLMRNIGSVHGAGRRSLCPGPHAIHLNYSATRPLHPSLVARYAPIASFRHLLSSLSQLVTLPFQSQVCLSRSKASPDGQVICLRPDLVHLR